jgi:DNA polymerase-1
LVDRLAQQELISVDTETTHVWPRWAEIVGISLAFAVGEAYYIPIRGPERQRCLDPRRTIDALRPVLENPKIAKIGQNLKYDAVVLRGAGVQLASIAFDTMVASYLLDAGSRSHSLSELAKRYLNQGTTDIKELIGRGKQQITMDQVPIDDVARYAADDAEIPLRLYPLLQKRLEEESLSELNRTIEVPVIDVLADLEYTGIRIEPGRLEELSARYEKRLGVLEEEIEELAGHPLNINSPKQLAQVLFEELGLPVGKKTKTGPSTDADVLEELAPLHPLPAKIVEYRQYSKLKGTYVDALPAMIHPVTGRVHASFNQVVTATGRLSSHDPNLQNIPVRSEEGREIRSAFIPGSHVGESLRDSHPRLGETRPRENWKLLAADYSQIELRVLAHFSQDARLCEAFANDEDIHTRVASQVYNVPFEKVTAAERRSAKAVNFGIIYGQSPFGLARSLGISQDEAAEFIDGYFAQYPGVSEFMTQTLATCRQQGYVTTILGRKRAIAGVRSQEFDLFGTRRQLNMPERTAVNTVIQGSAADIMKLAMLAVHRQLREGKLKANMLLQIHDELVFEVDPEHIAPLADMVRSGMRDVIPLRVPLKVDVKHGENWAECEPWPTVGE